MTKAQWNYVKIRLIVLGGIAGLVLLFVGMYYEWFIVGLLVTLGTFGMLDWCIAYIVAEIVYRWRVMGVTTEEEQDYFDRWWRCTIFDNAIEEKIFQLESNEYYTEWSDEERKTAIAYLYKVANVKRPKLLK